MDCEGVYGVVILHMFDNRRPRIVSEYQCCRQYFKYLKNVLVIRERMEQKKHMRYHTSWAYFPRHTVPSVLELVLNKNALVIIEMK